MEKLTRYEEAFLAAILKKEKRHTEEFLRNNSDGLEAYFAINETLPLIETILDKINI